MCAYIIIFAEYICTTTFNIVMCILFVRTICYTKYGRRSNIETHHNNKYKLIRVLGYRLICCLSVAAAIASVVTMESLSNN